jgi:hypothetical protein
MPIQQIAPAAKEFASIFVAFGTESIEMAGKCRHAELDGWPEGAIACTVARFTG